MLNQVFRLDGELGFLKSVCHKARCLVIASPLRAKHPWRCVNVKCACWVCIAERYLRARYIKRKAPERIVDNMPSCKFVVRQDEYLSIGGMEKSLFGGEDVDFCKRLTACGRPILYRPEIAVFHKNRSFTQFVLQRLAYGG